MTPRPTPAWAALLRTVASASFIAACSCTPSGTPSPVVTIAPTSSTSEADDPPSAAEPSCDALPEAIRFGVILIAHAEVPNAPEGSRSKAQALHLAGELRGKAIVDFDAAVPLGDTGSTADVGRMYRSILEPDIECALFSLPVGGVSEPIDTPRGYWIARRLDIAASP